MLYECRRQYSISRMRNLSTMRTETSLHSILCLLFFVLLSTSHEVDAVARFTQNPPDKLYVVKGQTARFMWDYQVDNRDLEFYLNSPKWYFRLSVDAKTIGVDVKYISWGFKIDTSSCPQRLQKPTVRVSRESNATLVITNVTTADEGEYGCVLVLQNSSPFPTSKSQLIVTETPRFKDRPNPITTVVEHTDLNISCTAVGPPPPNITWVNVTSGNTEVESIGTAVLRKISIKRDKNGTLFKCLATNNPNQKPIETKTTIIVYYPPEFTKRPVDTTVIQGDTIILHCQATANPPSSISWEREKNAAIKSGFTQFGNGTLIIPTAKKPDAGKYICKAMNVYSENPHTATANAFVTVKYPPTIYYNSNKDVVIENGTVRMRCTADGYPKPNITWSKKSGHIGTPNTGEWHNISSVNRSDAGTYTCTASNEIGNDATADIEVTVQYKPTIDKAASNTTGTSWNGHSMTLRCKWSTANPAPTWTWYKPDGSNITDKAKTIGKGSEVTVTTGQDSKDYGLYKCRATNVAGFDDHQINVTQLFPPGPPNVTVINIEASSVTVRWTKPANDGGSPVTGYKLEIGSETNEFGKSVIEDTVSGLKKDTQYVVKLFARNKVDYGNAATTTFTTKKQGPPAQPIIESVVVNQTSVILTWLKPEENGGEIRNYTVYQKDQDTTWKNVHIYATTKLLAYTVKNLERGKTYHFKVSATNEFGESAKGDSKAKIVTIPFATTIPPTTLVPGGPSKGQSSGGGGDPNQTIIIVGVVVAVILILITAVISIVILRKKNIFGQGTRKSGRNESAAYHNDVDTNDSLGRQAAAINLNGNDDIPTYAAVDMSKKTKKKTNDIPTYAVVDKSKKKRPGEIIYAELADFNTNNTAAAPHPNQYAGTDYADISQFQQQSEPEPTYANFQGRSKDYANVEDMSSQA